jgi:SAM-dependent methyltransferase
MSRDRQPLNSRPDRLADLNGRMEREREYWRTSESERPGEFSVGLLLQKTQEARVFMEAIERHRSRFESAEVVLELGGGQGWSACLLKALFGDDKTVITSDIGQAAIESLPTWESVFGAKVDRAFACPGFEIPLEDSSVDLVYAFDAAHHFGAHRRTLTEIRRVLRPGGVCLYLHEPTVPRALYRPAVRRVNAKRAGYGHDVVEDVLIGQRLLAIGRDLGFEAERIYAPSLAARSPKPYLYFVVVRRLGPAQRLVPSTADYVFEKQ